MLPRVNARALETANGRTAALLPSRRPLSAAAAPLPLVAPLRPSPAAPASRPSVRAQAGPQQQQPAGKEAQDRSTGNNPLVINSWPVGGVPSRPFPFLFTYCPCPCPCPCSTFSSLSIQLNLLFSMLFFVQTITGAGAPSTSGATVPAAEAAAALAAPEASPLRPLLQGYLAVPMSGVDFLISTTEDGYLDLKDVYYKEENSSDYKVRCMIMRTVVERSHRFPPLPQAPF
jgi:hypothetical protein